jgi:hypothetical protein
LFKEFKDVFSWTYEDLKTFDPNIIQHVIPMKPQAQPFSAETKEDASQIRTHSQKRIEQAINNQDHFPYLTYPMGVQFSPGKEEEWGNPTLCRFPQLKLSLR